jgi:6-phosphogluconolactonase
MNPEVVVLPDTQPLARAAARRFANLAGRAVKTRGRFSSALSGGSTPGTLYRWLAEDACRDHISWDKVHLFWGDERCVPPDDPGSNYRLAHETLIARVPIPDSNVHRIPAELEPEAAARAYAEVLRGFFGGPWPHFDLVLLGLGSDGHVASLFPGSPALHETARPVVAVTAQYEDRPARRVTLTLPAINAARHVLFLVSGETKAGILQAVLEGPAGQFPAQQVHPTAGRLTWLLDAGAASRLARGYPVAG